MSFLLALALSAAAQTEVCTQPYDHINLRASLGVVKDALLDQDWIGARDQLDETATRLPCTRHIVDRDLLARFARYMAAVHLTAEEPYDSRLWLVVAQGAAPSLEWDAAVFPPAHPLRDEAASLRLPERVALTDRGLAAPRGGAFFLNGELALVPQAAAEVPLLVQVFDDAGKLVDGWWQRGTGFPDAALIGRARPLPPPLWWGGEVPAPDPRWTYREPFTPDDGRVPLGTRGRRRSGNGKVAWAPILGTTALLAASGATYALADASAASLPEQTTSQGLTRTRTRTNLLVLTSGVALAGAVGVSAGAVLVHGNGVTVRF